MDLPFAGFIFSLFISTPNHLWVTSYGKSPQKTVDANLLRKQFISARTIRLHRGGGSSSRRHRIGADYNWAQVHFGENFYLMWKISDLFFSDLNFFDLFLFEFLFQTCFSSDLLFFEILFFFQNCLFSNQFFLRLVFFRASFSSLFFSDSVLRTCFLNLCIFSDRWFFLN